MGTIKHNLLLVLGIILLASLASAQIQLEDSSITLEVDYGQFNDDKQVTINEVTNEFTIKNTNPNESTVIVTASGLPSKYKVTQKSVLIPANGEAKVTLSLDVPHEQDPGETNIGKIIVKNSANQEVASATLVQNTKSMLKLVELEVDYTSSKGKSENDEFNGEDEKFTLDKEVKPASEILITLQLENLFDRDYDDSDGEIGELEIKIDADDSDIFESDFEDTFNLDDLANEKKIKYQISFVIDEEADAGDYSIEITIEGEDGKGVKYSIERTISLEVERSKDDLRIVTAEAQPVKECDTEIIFNLKVKNYGSDNQKMAAVSVVNSELGINKQIKELKIEEFGEDDEYNALFTFNELELKSKTYAFDVTTFIDSDRQQDFKRVNVVVDKCSNAAVETETDVPKPAEKNATVVPKSTASTNNTKLVPAEKISSATIVHTVEDPYTSDDFLIASLIVAFVLIMTMIILFVALTVRR